MRCDVFDMNEIENVFFCMELSWIFDPHHFVVAPFFRFLAAAHDAESRLRKLPVLCFTLDPWVSLKFSKTFDGSNASNHLFATNEKICQGVANSPMSRPAAAHLSRLREVPVVGRPALAPSNRPSSRRRPCRERASFGRFIRIAGVLQENNNGGSGWGGSESKRVRVDLSAPAKIPLTTPPFHYSLLYLAIIAHRTLVC